VLAPAQTHPSSSHLPYQKVGIILGLLQCIIMRQLDASSKQMECPDLRATDRWLPTTELLQEIFPKTVQGCHQDPNCKRASEGLVLLKYVPDVQARLSRSSINMRLRVRNERILWTGRRLRLVFPPVNPPRSPL